MCRDEEMFNQFLLSSLFKSTPEAIRQALSLHLRTDHRIVLTHGDLTPRNIIVQDCKIAGLIDWEDAGWYPEYWEYVKFFQRPSEGDWKQYAHDIFPMLYHEELVGYTAMSRWQES
jgi:aminoglycoside phosphotransferase (APT) family kinase protein